MTETLAEQVLGESFQVGADRSTAPRPARLPNPPAAVQAVEVPAALAQADPGYAASMARAAVALERRAHEAEARLEQWQLCAAVLREEFYRARSAQVRNQRAALECMTAAEAYKKEWRSERRLSTALLIALLCVIAWELGLFEGVHRFCAYAWDAFAVRAPPTDSRGAPLALTPVEAPPRPSGNDPKGSTARPALGRRHTNQG